MTYNNFDLAYIAGFFDGEGCVTISKQTERPNAKRQNGRSRFALQVSLTQKSRDTLDWVSLLFGGRVGFHQAKTIKFLCYRWTLTKKKDQQIFLRAILPFLRLKKAQAEYALQYLETVRDTNEGSRPVGDAIQKTRHELHDLIRKEKGHPILLSGLNLDLEKGATS